MRVRNTVALSVFDSTFKGAAILFVSIIVSLVSYLWIFSEAAWLHTELLRAPEYIWTPPRDASVLAQLRTLFDWAIFDSSPYRLRLLSDLLEVMDAITRPRTVWLFGLHPSLTLSSVTLAVLSGLCFYKALKHFGLSTAESALLTAVFLTTTGYLSCFVSYIRPAKKLAIFCICLSLCLVFRYIRIGGNRNLQIVLAGMFATLFTDEAAYASYGIASLFLLPYLLKNGLRKQAVFLMAVIPLFLLFAKVILPWIYNAMGHSGPRNEVVPSRLVRKLLGYLAEPQFYVTSVEELSRAALGTFGFTRVQIDLSVPFLLVFIGCAGLALTRILVVRTSAPGMWEAWQLIIATAAVFAMGLFLTLINWNAAPFGYNYYGSVTYYYYSPIVILALVWLASVIKLVRKTVGKELCQRMFSVALLILAVPVALVNYSNFRDVNKLIQTIHMWPLEPSDFHSQVRALPAIVAALPAGAPIPVVLVADRDGLLERFYPLSRSVLGSHSIDAEKNLAHFLIHPIGTEAYVRAYVRAFYPQHAVDVRIEDASRKDKRDRGKR